MGVNDRSLDFNRSARYFAVCSAVVSSPPPNLLFYDAENRLKEVKKNNVSIASFVYDGDGKRVKSTLNGTTTTFVGNHYEISGSTITKYYYAGATRIAMRVNGTLSYLFSDHLGSTGVAADAQFFLILKYGLEFPSSPL